MTCISTIPLLAVLWELRLDSHKGSRFAGRISLCDIYIQRKDRSVIKLVVWDWQNPNCPTAFSFELEPFISSVCSLVPQYTLKGEFIIFSYLATLSVRSAVFLESSSEVLTAGTGCAHIEESD